MPSSDYLIFKEIAESGSMSKGAERCGISQSAASQHVQEVERRLGAALLDRGKRPLALTAAGKLYADLCREVVLREEQFQAALDELKRQAGDTVRVASIYSIGLSEMSGIREAFEARFPAAHLEVDYMRPDQIYRAVLNRSADLGLVSYPESSREIAALPWRQEEMQLAVPPSHPLAGRARVYPADLNGTEYVAFDEDLTIRRELDRFLRTEGVEVHIAMHFDNIQTIKEAVAFGSGVSILPARTMQAEIEQGRIVAVPLEAPGLKRPVGILHRRRKKLHPAAQAFLNLLTGG
ncbi:MAG: LysR family transcriptional regulator [Bryobacteraceae bacterium]